MKQKKTADSKHKPILFTLLLIIEQGVQDTQALEVTKQAWISLSTQNCLPYWSIFLFAQSSFYS